MRVWRRGVAAGDAVRHPADVPGRVLHPEEGEDGEDGEGGEAAGEHPVQPLRNTETSNVLTRPMSTKFSVDPPGPGRGGEPLEREFVARDGEHVTVRVAALPCKYFISQNYSNQILSFNSPSVPVSRSPQNCPAEHFHLCNYFVRARSPRCRGSTPSARLSGGYTVHLGKQLLGVF